MWKNFGRYCSRSSAEAAAKQLRGQNRQVRVRPVEVPLGLGMLVKRWQLEVWCNER